MDTTQLALLWHGLLKNIKADVIFQARFLYLSKIFGPHTHEHAHHKANSKATKKAALGMFPRQDRVTKTWSKLRPFLYPLLTQTL